jgi:hypothetical protein
MTSPRPFECRNQHGGLSSLGQWRPTIGMTALRAERLRASSIEGKGSIGEVLDVEPAVTRPLNLTGIDGSPSADICGWVKNDPIGALHAIADLDRRAAIANHGELSDVDGAFLDSSDPQAVRTEQDGFRRNYHRLGFARNLEVHLAICSGREQALGIGHNDFRL